MVIEQSAVSMYSERSFTKTIGMSRTSILRPKGSENSLGSFSNYLKSPLKTGALQKTGRLGTSESLRAIRLQLLHHIFDMLRAYCGLSPSGCDTQTDASDQTEMSGLSGGSLWTRTDSTSFFYAESEETTFESTGIVKCADGRSINFGVSFSMSRSFSAVFEQVSSRDYVFTDPLVINLDSSIVSVSDQKFLFDLDGDGAKENISFAGSGNGFLALDKNEDGIINDGSELFGTASGNGFSDLSEYDSDGNGWIDEADEIFDKLRVWVKSGDGSDSLIRLKDADVGAIFLGNIGTDFSIKDAANNTQAALRRSGLFLRESGGSGTIGQVDLVS